MSDRQPDPWPQGMAYRLINLLARHRSADLYLVLDDYHLIPTQGRVNDFLDLFIERMPSYVHVVILSREPLPFKGVPRWISKREMTELTGSDLALASEDAKALISACYGAVLPSEEFQRLMERTQGWMAGVHLIMQAAGMHKSVKETLNGYLAANRPLFDYFTSEIMRSEPQDTASFLRDISVMEDLDPEACDKVAQRNGSLGLLEDLERRHIFTTVSAEGTYRLHPMFRSYLYDGLESGRRQECHRRREVRSGSENDFRNRRRTEGCLPILPVGSVAGRLARGCL